MPPHAHAANRRDFLHAAGATIAAASLAPLAAAAPSASSEKKFKKAVKYGMIKHAGSIMDKFKLLSDLGFDGVEVDGPTSLDKDELLAARDKTGIEIPGVVEATHWKDTFSDPRAEVRAKAVETLEGALRDAKLLGATSVLLVPAVVSKEVSYADAYKRSQEAIRKALPLAAEMQVKIAFENVWNNFLLSPLETARYVDEFESPWVGVHFDVGNVVRYGWPEQWIRTLGKRIVKLDIKEYSRKIADEEGVRKGFRAELLEGDCDWPAVMKALGEIGYTGWGAAEVPGGGEDRLREISVRMDRIFAS
ncbi:MAG TPA: sugar phosphate isomerase/epimerase family protein [Pirellulales bacterium]|nr:sugar phosphate isomerase/epimerase family protein [Pirellulales bacterium]